MLNIVSQPLTKLARTRRLMNHYAVSHGVSRRRQVLEMARLWRSGGIGPLEYYYLGLFRPTVPWAEKLNTIRPADYWKLIQLINPPRLRTIATNKFASYAMLRAAGIPTPTIHGIFGPSGRTTAGEPLESPPDLAALIAERSLRELCLKPLSAWSGKGVLKVRCNGSGGATVLPDGPTLSLGDLQREYLNHGRERSYLVQDGIAQHPGVARLHPSSVNTMRVWMFQHRDGEWQMGPNNLRMGVGGSVVDNTSAGGIGAAVDNDSGRLSAAIIRGLDPDSGVFLEEFPVHPTTGETIEGTVLPMWEEACDLCRRTCDAFSFYGLMGLDVAFGVDHPWVIEVEADPHAWIQVYVGRGIKRDIIALAGRARRARVERRDAQAVEPARVR
jgi:hypothetical protein